MRFEFHLLPLLSVFLFLTACGGEAQQAPPQTPASIPPPGPSAPVMYRLPVSGTWRVQNTHYGNRYDQAYAIDIVLPATAGKFFENRGQQNADWPGYGQPVVADAPGIVAIAVDGVPDNDPRSVNKYDMHGNYVVIDHQNGEYSLMAHLIPGSVRVRPGQVVAAGTELGRCGNSGHSTNPHLHWQVMDNVNAMRARGIIPRLLPYERNGEPSTELPNKGDFIQLP